MFGRVHTYPEKLSGRGYTVRLLLFTCLLLLALVGVSLAAPVQAGDSPGRPLYQDSPLSPLAAPATSEFPSSAPATTPPISLVLVGVVLAGVLIVVGLVIWRQ